MSLIIDGAVMSHCGKVSKANEDNFIFSKMFLPEDNNGMKTPYGKTINSINGTLIGVFDGMGGEQYGQTASHAVAEMLSKKGFEIINENTLTELCFELNSLVLNVAKIKCVKTCGTTCAMVLFTFNSAFFCNVGDSKIIRIRNHEAVQISKDHLSPTILNGVKIKRKPTLTQYIGVDPEDFLIEPFCKSEALIKDDVYIICSDGLSDSVTLKDFSDAVAKHRSSKELAEHLVSLALSRDGRDNITVIVCFVGEDINDK